MLTIFSTPKPFKGHVGVIQRNALKSWTLLHPDCEVILLGDESGTAEAARDFGIRHVPQVECNESGTPYLNSIFGQAQNLARYRLVCYVNCDIMLMSDFWLAVQRVSSWRERFLMIGRRWNVDVMEPWRFQSPDWEHHLRTHVFIRGKLLTQHAIDYFVFPREMYSEIPPFVIGRFWWDHWLVWRARSISVPVVDATPSVMAVHQNHDYSYHPQGFLGALHGREAQVNREFAGNGRHLFTIDDATHRFTRRGIERNRFFWMAPWRRKLVRLANATWYPALEATKPLRYALGLRRWRA
jgi:hypothetical protein